MPERPAYITTPIYYVNDRPHVGHCYTTLVADCLARFERLRRGSAKWSDDKGGGGGGVFFLTGTDEHADKVVTTGAENKCSPQEWSDRNAAEFEKAFAFMGSSHDDFIRTTQDRHKSRVVEYVAALMKSGAIYPGTYEGWYDTNQEEYLTETAAKEGKYVSAVTGKPLVRRSEKCYFFKLSAYQQRLAELFKANPDFVRPESRRNEVLGRLRDGLQDVPVSRPVTDDPATRWGIRVPGDEGHRIYVWIDALFNYLSVVDTDARRALWPATVHFIAKDILWFHAVIWPALLMALHDADPGGGGGRFGFVTPPRSVYSHAYWVREGRKMSKSLGNFVTIEVLRAYADKFSLDALRWYLLTQGPLGATDADFTHSKFVEVYNADLANGIGNCASRVGNMVEKYFGGKVPEYQGSHEVSWFRPDASFEIDWPQSTTGLVNGALGSADAFDIGESLSAGTKLIRNVDQFINVTAPFKIAKLLDTHPDKKPALAMILYQCAEAIRIASILLSPALPHKMAQLWQTWNCAPTPGVPLEQLCAFAGPHSLKPGQQIAKGEPLFMRADPADPPPA